MNPMLTDRALKLANALHRGLLRVSGGRIGSTLGSMPVIELHVKGRKSGKTRVTMLIAPIVENGAYVLVASKGGDDRHPEWYLNVVANPDVELVTAAGARLALRARTASAEEKDELWPRITTAYKGYAGYAAKTNRDIPVVLCEPRPG